MRRELALWWEMVARPEFAAEQSGLDVLESDAPRARRGGRGFRNGGARNGGARNGRARRGGAGIRLA
ncbi:hypothetical protein GCM10028798_00920 [Humibacter antri]